MNHNTRPLWLLRQARQLVYPRRCPFCGRVLGFLPTCEECAPALDLLRRSPSMRLSSAQHLLHDLDGAAAPYRYSGSVRRAVLTAKYHNAPWAAEELGVEMAHLLFGSEVVMRGAEPLPRPVEGYERGYQLILPVPPSNRRRGYNVPERMARPLSAVLGVPLRTDLLLRVCSRRKQEGLTLEERLENVANAFQTAHPEQLENKRILLIDDVITTGATISACAHVLLQAGAESVYAMAFATVEPAPAAPNTSPPSDGHTTPEFSALDSAPEEDDLFDF